MQTLELNPIELGMLTAGIVLFTEYYDGDINISDPDVRTPLEDLVSKINVAILGDVTKIHALMEKLNNANLSAAS